MIPDFLVGGGLSMGEKDVERYNDPEVLRLFMKSLLNDLRALDSMLNGDIFETGVRRIGAEQELVLTDSQWQPAPEAMKILEAVDDDCFTTELAKFNLEFNLPPLLFKKDCLSQLESDVVRLLKKVHEVAESHGTHILLTGILPTIRKADLDVSNLTPRTRYFALNDALRSLRGDAFEFRFTGTDELIIRHESVMLEACNTSCQFHFQVAPDEFARFYNIAQAVAGPVLCAAANSPLLFGKRLWRETRIALFQQAIDTRQPGHQLQERSSRVSFGHDWIQKSVMEIFREDVARFRVVLGMMIEEDPFEVLNSGGIPRLRALQLHNSTVYRWMRPCYGILNGKPHLRIENRVMPSGPTVIDEVSNAAFWFGLVSGLAEQYEDVTEVLEFDVAKSNFLAAARLGLAAQLEWTDGLRIPAQELLCKKLLPMAQNGLESSGIDKADIDRYLGVIEARVASGRTGAHWQEDSLNKLRKTTTRSEQLIALTAAMWARQQEGKPVHEWECARAQEAGGWQKSFKYVEQYMTTDVFSVHEGEVIDLVANLMDWERIRHVPVEDDHHRLVGLISYRQLLRFLAHDLPHGKGNPVSARQIMQRNPITVTPETRTMEAIRLMRTHKVACLPVVKDERLVGIITDADFMSVAAELLDMHLGEP
ncbi:MAG: CBS domain-containing protein [Planctomycetota bacterium]|jgi:CBS domain-containing protein/gamma-glutamyl:cysteine ligase YbdK (ATP-grasp superfamily)